VQAIYDGLGEQPKTAVQESIQHTPGRQSDEIVVIGRRGEAAVVAETEFNEDDIAADGSDSIQELLSNLQPFIDPSGAQPVILINGKPTGFDTSILSYPIEALARVAVLKPEAGPRYGAKAGTRVVNLVLKPKFASFASEAGINAATAGGQYGGSLNAMRTTINGDTRWNASAQFNRQSALLKSARRISRSTGVFIPGSAIDPDDFETLQPSTRNAMLGITFARPLGNLAASVSLNASRSRSNGLRGLPRVSPVPTTDSDGRSSEAIVPPGPSFASTRALRNNNGAQALGASLTLTGPIWGVQTSLGASFSSSDGYDLLETSADIARSRHTLEPDDQDFGSHSPHYASFLNVRSSRSRASSLNFNLNLQKAVLDLPAGPVSWGFSTTAGLGHSLVTQRDNAGHTSARSNYARSGSTISVSLPISSSGSAFAAFRDLAIDLSIGRQSAARGSAGISYGSGMTWAPTAQVQLRGSVDRFRNLPSPDQLNGPLMTTVKRIFDYVQREFAEPTWTIGGNPLLGRGSQTGVSLSMMVKPLSRQELTLNFAYSQFVATDGPASFPELTPAIEAAFPGRVTRDNAGRLLAVDARPINIAREKDANLSSGLTFRLGGARRRPAGGAMLQLAVDPTQVNLSLNHRWRLQSETLIRRGLPVIDRLIDSGASRHELNFQISVSKRAFGANLGTNWGSSTHVTGNDGEFQLTPPLMFSLSTFVDVDRVLDSGPDKAWTQGMKISFDIQNVFRGYRRIALPGGSVPAGYSRDEVDPLGRTVRLTLRKQF
jgi:hypothetical protein